MSIITYIEEQQQIRELNNRTHIFTMPYPDFYEIVWRLMKYAEDSIAHHDYRPKTGQGIIVFRAQE